MFPIFSFLAKIINKLEGKEDRNSPKTLIHAKGTTAFPAWAESWLTEEDLDREEIDGEAAERPDYLWAFDKVFSEIVFHEEADIQKFREKLWNIRNSGSNLSANLVLLDLPFFSWEWPVFDQYFQIIGKDVQRTRNRYERERAEMLASSIFSYMNRRRNLRQSLNPTIRLVRPFWKMMKGNPPFYDKCKSFSGVRRFDDNAWEIDFPPHGVGCRCGTMTMSKRDLEKPDKH